MTNALTILAAPPSPMAHGETMQEFVTMRLGAQLFGISVMSVRDVMHAQRVAPIPLAPAVVVGALNLRGRIVTAFDMRQRLNMSPYPAPEKIMKVLVEFRHELFALMVDAVGDVLSLPMQQFEKSPANMDATWRSIAAGIFKLEQELLVILDVASVIEGAANATALEGI